MSMVGIWTFPARVLSATDCPKLATQIDFEGLDVGTRVNGLNGPYSGSGVIFPYGNPVVVDPIVATSSGTHALQMPSVPEDQDDVALTTTTLTIDFTAQQSHVWMKVGLEAVNLSSMEAKEAVARLTAWQKNNTTNLYEELNTEPTFLDMHGDPVTHCLSVQDSQGRIDRVTLETLKHGTPGNELEELIDNLSYDVAGTAPQIPMDNHDPIAVILWPLPSVEAVSADQILVAGYVQDDVDMKAYGGGSVTLKVEDLRTPIEPPVTYNLYIPSMWDEDVAAGVPLCEETYPCTYSDGHPDGKSHYAGKRLYFPAVPVSLFGAGPGTLNDSRITLTVTDIAGKTASASMQITRFDPGPNLDIRVKGMEITQAIQTWVARAAVTENGELQFDQSQAIPLIQGRRTVVRVYPEAEGPVTAFGYVALSVGAKLCRVLNTGEECLRFQPEDNETVEQEAQGLQNSGPVNIVEGVGLDNLRADAAKSWNFLLPTAWTQGTLNLRAEVNTPSDLGYYVRECSGCSGNNSLKITDIPFLVGCTHEESPAIDVSIVTQVSEGTPCGPSSYDFDERVDIRQISWEPPDSDPVLSSFDKLAKYMARLEKLYPLDKGSFKFDGSAAVRITSAVCKPFHTEFPQAMVDADSPPPLGTWVSVAFYRPPACKKAGHTQGGKSSVKPKDGEIQKDLMSVEPRTARATYTLAHEIGHGFWLKHASECHTENSYEVWPYAHGSLGDYGFDTYGMSAKTPLTGEGCPESPNPHFHDFMSYGKSLGGWVSVLNYCRLFNRLGGYVESGPCDPPLPTLLNAPAMLGPGLIVYASLGQDGSVALEPFYRLDRIRLSQPDTLGSFTLVLESKNGTELLRFPFDFDVGECAGEGNEGDPYETDCLGEEEEAPSISLGVPFIEGTARIMIVKDGKQLAAREVSRNAPKVSLLSPRRGEAWRAQGKQTLQWSASDADGDPLNFILQYSRDGGVHYSGFASVKGDSLTVDSSMFAGSRQGKLRIIATDGANTTMSEMEGTFSVAGKPPYAYLLAPEDGAKLLSFEGDMLSLEGRGMDQEDGDLSGASLVWTSDLQGKLGTGVRLDTTTLEPGLHHITFTVRDSDGETDTDALTVRVLPFSGKAAAQLIQPRFTQYTNTLEFEKQSGLSPLLVRNLPTEIAQALQRLVVSLHQGSKSFTPDNSFQVLPPAIHGLPDGLDFSLDTGKVSGVLSRQTKVGLYQSRYFALNSAGQPVALLNLNIQIRQHNQPSDDGLKLLSSLEDLLHSFESLLTAEQKPDPELLFSHEDLLHGFEKLLHKRQEVNGSLEKKLLLSYECLIHGFENMLDQYYGLEPSAMPDHCKPNPGDEPSQKPDLVPVPSGIGSFCVLQNGELVVTVENIGKAEANPSATTVTFGDHGVVSQETPSLDVGRSTTLIFKIPPGCYDPDCGFRIEVDSDSVINEEREDNNVASDSCPG
jgi:hypothetical protein